jgi:hypothetical protein
VLFLIVLGWSAWTDYQHRAQARRLLGSGSIEATEVEVSPKVPGRVTWFIVKEGARIQAPAKCLWNWSRRRRTPR